MVNACIIGCGIIAPVHLKAINSIDNGNIYGVCDTDKERAEKYAKEYDAKAFYSFDDVLDDENVDVIHICTPHHLHVDMAIKAISKGKHIVLEKPCAINNEEFEKLLTAYKASDKKICSVFQNRTNTCIEALKDIISENKDGKLLGISGAMRWMRNAAYYNRDAWRGKYATEGGGVLINQSIHLLDLILLFGGKVKRVCASQSNKSLQGVIEVEDTIDALIEFESGLKASFYATNSYPVNQPFQLELNFENATYRYADNNLYKIEKGECTFICKNDASVPGKDYWGGGHKRVIFDFYNAIENGTEYIDLSDAVQTTKTMFAIYDSAKNKGEIKTL